LLQYHLIPTRTVGKEAFWKCWQTDRRYKDRTTERQTQRQTRRLTIRVAVSWPIEHLIIFIVTSLRRKDILSGCNRRAAAATTTAVMGMWPMPAWTPLLFYSSCPYRYLHSHPSGMLDIFWFSNRKVLSSLCIMYTVSNCVPIPPKMAQSHYNSDTSSQN